MTAFELLSNLRSKDIEIWADGDQLRYKAPKGALTPDLRKELAARKSEILALLRQIDTAAISASFPLKRFSRAGDLPLSFAQERLWFLHHIEPDSVAYSMPRSIRLRGMLRKDALKKAYVELARRHETLRTTFHSTDGNPLLRIAAEPNILFDTLDLRHLPGVEREAEARRLREEDARKPFDLTRGPLFRIRLFQLKDEEHVLYFNRHHIISDHWSFGVMARETAALYTAFINGKPADLPELPVQYADYALWQRQWLQGEALEVQLNYWKDKLGGELPVLELPTDRPRPAVQTHRGAIESLALPKELTEALQAMSRREGVTLFMTLLAAFKILLYRLTGQADTIVGTPIAGRNRTELEGLIGFFMNTIVLRTDLAGQPTFRELIGRVRETALEAYAHQDMPFAKLVEELSPERDLSRPPLFQVFFNHIVARGDKTLQLPGLEAEAVGGLDRESKFDLSLTVLEGQGGLAVRFEYNTDLFDAERIERMVGHFQTLLEGIVADPAKCICDLPIIDEAERRQLLVDWNDTAVEYPRDKCIHELFENQVEQTPDAAAVIFGKQRLTYRELNVRANQLAHYLRLQGVVAETRVGIWMDRSLDMMIALLGTLKAGGAYVPLDPSYPQERLAFMLEDAQAPVLLTREKFLEDLPAYAGHVVCLDKDFEEIAGGSEENPISDITPDSAAYVIYTSGSTGTPKGVIGLHRGAVNRLSWMWRVYPFKDGEVCCQKTYLSFVDSVWEIFGSLLKGVPAVLIPEESVKDPHLLVDFLAAARVSRIALVPSLLRVLLDSFGDLQKRLFDLKIWVTSGEEISVELAQRFRQAMPEAKLINLYGSSEVSADVTCYEVAGRMLDRSLPIGRPVDNTSIYILDFHLQPVPVGVPGELYIGGVGLARGYLNQPDLTAERFIPSPFGQKEVLFKTGDLGRYLPDGNIEYLGRIDHQVKVRGFRIELGEIEYQIKGLDAVSNCVVMLREDRPADQRLTAYYVCKDGQAVSDSEVRRQLQAKLPEYMLPTIFMKMDALPLTPNGKVDRRALPAPDKIRQAHSETFIAPRNELELQVTKIWETVLDIRPIGITDNFFELGGHSMLALRLFAQIQKIFKKELPLSTLFEAPTIEKLANILTQKKWSPPWSSLVPIHPGGSNWPFFCIHGCGGEVLNYYALASHLIPKQPFYALRAQGLDTGQAVYTRIEEMAEYYIKEIQTIQPKGPYFLGGGGGGGKIAFEMAQQLTALGQKVALLVLIDPPVARRISSDLNLTINRKTLNYYGRLLVYHFQHRQLTKAAKNNLFNRVLKRWRIFHRFIPSHIRRIQRVRKTQIRALLDYVPEVYPGRITYFLREEFSNNPQARIGTWNDLAVGGLDVRIVPDTHRDRDYGGHGMIFKEPHVRVLAQQLGDSLDKAQAEIIN